MLHCYDAWTYPREHLVHLVTQALFSGDQTVRREFTLGLAELEFKDYACCLSYQKQKIPRVVDQG